jgi:hypothetical protein
MNDAQQRPKYAAVLSAGWGENLRDFGNNLPASQPILIR